MELTYNCGKIIIENKVINLLDKFVLDFTELLEKYTEYVVVSGYIAILFGRARGTEDIDILIRNIDKDVFTSFYQNLIKEGYYFLNPEDMNELYEMLEDGLGIRIAKKDTIIPNIELKFIKDDFDKYSIDKRLIVVINKNHLFISPIELQIAYKLYLSSNKDIEDAVYLWGIFKEKIDVNLLKKFMNALKVKGEKYGIKV